MAVLNYTINEPKYADVLTGYPKVRREKRLVSTREETGSKEIPFVTKTRTSARSALRESVDVCSVRQGSERSLTTLPSYPEGHAAEIAACFVHGIVRGGGWGIPTTQVFYLRSTTYNGALLRFVDEMMDNVDTSSLGVSVMEGRDSLQMIANRCGNLAMAVIEVRRGNMRTAYTHFQNAMRLLSQRSTSEAVRKRIKKKAEHENADYLRFRDFTDAVTNGWLEYWLGWAPFVSDVGKLTDVLANTAQKLTTEGIWLKASKRCNLDISGNGYTQSYKRLDAFRTIGVFRTTISGRVRVDNMQDFLNRRAGLTNLPAVIYAGVPFSFIVDWFVGIGAALSLLDAFTGIQWMGGTLSRSIDVESTETWSYRASSLGAFDAKTVGVSRARFHKRDLLVNAPTGAPVPKFKDLSKIFDDKVHRAATSVSLLTQVLLNKSYTRDLEKLRHMR